jgi:anion-transporting  ArsA/GET3 family ATPase
MTMDTEASLREYLHLQLHLPTVSRLGPLAKVFDFVSTAAPGVREILTVGKIGWEVRERHYDLVVVDAPATGHIVGQLTAPQAIKDLVRVGQVREQTGWLADLLADPATTGLVIVTTPEEMPVNETIDLVGTVRSETNIDVAAIVVNRVLPELFSGADEEIFERLSEPALSDRLADVVRGPVAPVLDAARLAVTLRRTRAGHLDHLRSALDPAVPMLYVPYLFARGHGLRTTGQVADALSAELGY